MPNPTSISTIERLDRVAEYIDRHEHVSVVELCAHFDISKATVRRVLDALAEQKRIQRVHGGATRVQNAPPEPSILIRSSEQAAEKMRIGSRVASMIRDGETVFIGSGSTAYEVARQLKSHSRLTVITNSLLVVNELIHQPQFDLINLGGIVRQTELSFIGHLTDQALSQLRTDKVIMGIHAIDPDYGLTNDYLEETLTDRSILQSGKEVIVVADHTKCGRVSKAFVAPVDAIDVFVTGTETPDEFAARLVSKGVQVIRV